MQLNARLAQWVTLAVLGGGVALVYQQITTNMASQGIAEGGPYDNGAAFPGMVAIILGGLVLLQAALQWRTRAAKTATTSVSRLVRPALLVAIFALYVIALAPLGYHLATPVFLASLMWLCGLKHPLAIILPAVLMSFTFAFLFEAGLNIVLPGGLLHLNIGW